MELKILSPHTRVQMYNTEYENFIIGRFNIQVYRYF